MLEKLVADVLVRVLGQYVHGITPETVRVGVWNGHLALQKLALRPDSLAVLFETLGLDLPVTVVAGYIGNLTLHVPWKALRSEPVVLSVKDLAVVAAPVSDGDQEALAQRDLRLKASRLATDDAIREARESVRAAADAAVAAAPGGQHPQTAGASTGLLDGGASSSRLERWRRRLIASIVASVVNNIQVHVHNVIVQYQDASSVRARPYTVSLAVESLRAISTDSDWKEAYITDTDSPFVRKVVYLDSLVANWEPGTGDKSHSTLSCAEWAANIRQGTRHVIRPVHGELRVALASTVAHTLATSRLPRVQMDLCFPEVAIAFDDFQYHTLLSTIMYLSDIDRKVRPKTPRGRWQWAVDRLLPRFQERHNARLRLTAEGMREWREKRELYVRARKAVVKSRHKGADHDLVASEASVLRDMELILPLRDILLFRDIADMEMRHDVVQSPAVATPTRFWSLMTRSKSSVDDFKEGKEKGDVSSLEYNRGISESESLDTKKEENGENDYISDSADGNDFGDDHVPVFRMAFLLGRGSIQLSNGGYPDDPTKLSCLEFHELRLGVTTWQARGFLIEGLLGTLEVVDLQNNIKVMYPRVDWTGVGSGRVTEGCDDVGHLSREFSHESISLSDSEAALFPNNENITGMNNDMDRTSVTAAVQDFLSSYPTAISNALHQIRGGYEKSDSSLFRPTQSGLTGPSTTAGRLRLSTSSASTSSLQSDTLTTSSVLSQGRREDLTLKQSEPLDYLVALRLQQEPSAISQKAPTASNRLAMDLAIGGLEALVDGPNGVFVSSIQFWHPREKLPSIMKFLSRAAAPRLASLRMNLQRVLLDRKAPMRMDLLIRGPRFIIPGRVAEQLSLVVDLGTFAMETASGDPQAIVSPCLARVDHAVGKFPRETAIVNHADIQCTDYRMAVSDLGVFIVSAGGKRAAERLIKPFALRLLLQVLHDASFIEAVVEHLTLSGLARVRMFGYLSSVKTTVSHAAFRQLLEIAHQWTGWVAMENKPSGIEPNSPRKAVSVPAVGNNQYDLRLHDNISQNFSPRKSSSDSGICVDDVIVLFDLRLELDDLRLELRDLCGKRVVTLSSQSTFFKYVKGRSRVELDYRVQSFTIEDGSRGATAPFRQLLHACEMDVASGGQKSHCTTLADHAVDSGRSSIISVHYVEDIALRRQDIDVEVQSLSIICVRETYLALADFFYKAHDLPSSGDSDGTSAAGPGSTCSERMTRGTGDEKLSTCQSPDPTSGYVDPFAAVGMTTSSAVRALRTRAERGMELSKKAFADRGQLKVRAKLAGFIVTLITAEGALASLELQECAVRLLQTQEGLVRASGEVQKFSVRDLTAAHDALSQTVSYECPSDQRLSLERTDFGIKGKNMNSDGWTLEIPTSSTDNIWLRVCLRNLRIMYVQRFAVILKQYVTALRDELQPVLAIKGGLSDIFEGEVEDRWKVADADSRRLQLSIVTENIDFILPRHSQCSHEALRFVISRSTVTNEEYPAPGYLIGMQVNAENITSYVVHGSVDAENSDFVAAADKPPEFIPVSFSSLENLVPFSSGLEIVGKLDLWRLRRVPQVILNADGNPILKDGELEIDYDPQQWLPALRARLFAPKGIDARLCEAEYTILYFVFTENFIERPEIEFTDIVRGLRTPILPPRRPVQPIMLSSNRLPANYNIVFEISKIESIVSYGSNRSNPSTHLITATLTGITGCFEYGVDFRMLFEVSCDIDRVEDLRPGAKRPSKIVQPIRTSHSDGTSKSRGANDRTRAVAFTWDRPYGHRANLMLVMSNLRVLVVPELFRDLGALTAPGYPFLRSSAPAPWLKFNGRQLIVTLSCPEICLMSEEYPGDIRSLVLRGELIAKIHWAAVTGRILIEMAANNLRCGLSNRAIEDELLQDSDRAYPMHNAADPGSRTFGGNDEAPLVYPLDISLKYHAGGYDPPATLDGSPVRAPGSTIEVYAEYFLGRIDVKDIPVILAVGSRFAHLQASPLSQRPPQPGRFDEWSDCAEEGDAKLSVQFGLPHARVLFTDETDGRYIPILEARARDFALRSNVPWLTSARVEISIDLFNEDKGWWEPGIERFPVELVASQGRSGSTAVNIRMVDRVEINLTPSTVSGAARVAKTLKMAIENLISRITRDKERLPSQNNDSLSLSAAPVLSQTLRCGRRPSVAAFCIQNRTGRPASVWAAFGTSKTILRGGGDELEVDLPTDGVLWPSIVGNIEAASDSNRSRHTLMRCYVSFSGYETVTLSAAEVGTEHITLLPDITNSIDHERSKGLDREQKGMQPMEIIWEVSMRDGVPVGTLRSVVRVINETRTVLEIIVGRSNDNRKCETTSSVSHATQDGQSSLSNTNISVLEVGSSFCVPVYSVTQSIRIRPALFHPPEHGDTDEVTTSLSNLSQSKQRVIYSYQWSEALSRKDAYCNLVKGPENGDSAIRKSSPLGRNSNMSRYLLSCRSVTDEHPFTFSVFPVVNNAAPWVGILKTALSGDSIDLYIRAPIVIENLLPRPLSFVLADSQRASLHDTEAILARGSIKPLREAHVHAAGGHIERLALGLGFDNSPRHRAVEETSWTGAVTALHRSLDCLTSIPLGSARSSSVILQLHRPQAEGCHKLSVYADFWIENRSDIDLFFRDFVSSDPNANAALGRPKVFLPSCSLDRPADPFICFSGHWLSFQRADSTEDTWISVAEDITDVVTPVTLPFEGLGLSLVVRPAKGKFQRALIVSVRNSAWIQNRSGRAMQWCQSTSLSSRGIVLSSHVHGIDSGNTQPLHWDFSNEEKSVCLRLVEEDGSSDWIWSRPVPIEWSEGEFVAKMYCPKRHEQYIARTIVSKLSVGTRMIVIYPEDRRTPPYRIANHCARRSIAFRQAGDDETHPWLVRPGKTTRYSWDDPGAPLKRRSLIVEVIESRTHLAESSSTKSLGELPSAGIENDETGIDFRASTNRKNISNEYRYPKFELSIDILGESFPMPTGERFSPPLGVSVTVDGPTKVVTFFDKLPKMRMRDEPRNASLKPSLGGEESVPTKSRNIDLEIYVEGVGISLVDDSPTELAFLCLSGLLFRLDRFDSSQLIFCQVSDVQLDNQLPNAVWPVALWSPLLGDDAIAVLSERSAKPTSIRTEGSGKKRSRKPVLQFTCDEICPDSKAGINRFRGIFAAVQFLRIATDEEFVLRIWLFVQSLLVASGEFEGSKNENFGPCRCDEYKVPVVPSSSCRLEPTANVLMQRLYVEQLELCPVKLRVSFTSSRSAAVIRLAGYRSLIRTLISAFGNVDNAVLRFNALELKHVFDTTLHFRSLITEYYLGQIMSQKMTLLTSNPLIGNPSALFDSIAIGTRDFFVEPARARSSADFIVGIGRGSSSLLTNTFGGIVGSLGGIPRAMAQGLETAVGDSSYLAERDMIRGRARCALTPAQGLFTGAMSFGHGIASGAAGLVREPVAGALESGPSGFLVGLGKGVIGGVLKPITGALDLIGEPAVGFRSMMTSGFQETAETLRAPRAFWGGTSKRLVAYDERAALGQAILSAVRRAEDDSWDTNKENLKAWLPLVTVSPDTSRDALLPFLWTLHRRSLPNSQIRSRTILDGSGEAVRADKMKCALLTQMRLLIASLDGHVLWQRPISCIVGTQVSLEATEVLMVGVVSAGRSAEETSPPSWERIACGSVENRDELNLALRKLLRWYRKAGEYWSDRRVKCAQFDDRASFDSAEDLHRHDEDIEMVDMSLIDEFSSEQNGNISSWDSDPRYHLRSKMPRGTGDLVPGGTRAPGAADGPGKPCIIQNSSQATMRLYVKITIVNNSDYDVTVSQCVLSSGRWMSLPPCLSFVSGQSVIFEAVSNDDYTCDIAGRIALRTKSSSVSLEYPDGVHTDDASEAGEISLFFMNPMLAANAYSAECPNFLKVTQQGGDRGDWPSITFYISNRKCWNA